MASSRGILLTDLHCVQRLRQYQQQLEQVQGALKGDPENEELRTLEGELKNLIDLTTQLISAQASDDTPSTSSIGTDFKTRDNVTASADHRYAVGDECEAKYEADGRWYAARIVAVAGSMQNPMYTILFKGYSDTEVVTSSSIKATKDTASVQKANGQLTSKSTSKRLSAAEEAERERKKRRSEKKAERFASRTAEANAVQNSWQKFAKKAEKKGVMKKDKSIFKTPDDPLAKGGYYVRFNE